MNIEYIRFYQFDQIQISNIFVFRYLTEYEYRIYLFQATWTNMTKLNIRIRICNIRWLLFENSNIFMLHCICQLSRQCQGKVKAKSRQGQGKVKAKSRQGQGKVEARSKQGQGKVKTRSRQGQGKVKGRSRQGQGKVRARSKLISVAT